MRHSSFLYVDDNADLREAVTALLDGGPYVSCTAPDGPAALEALERQKFDAVICDLDMPGMNGLEFLSRARERHPDLRRVLVSGSTSAHLLPDDPPENPPYHLVTAKPFTREGWERLLERVMPRPLFARA